MSVLFFIRCVTKPLTHANQCNDRFVLSKKLEFVDVATGSLGQGLGAACGMAYTGKHFDSPGIENMDNWHGKPIRRTGREAIKDLEAQIQNPKQDHLPELPNEDPAPADLSPITLPSLPIKRSETRLPTRKAYGVALAKLGQSSPRVGLWTLT
ncbi:hypothetical protein J4Q44_G00264900 [Coregonus suidteri]|uniref:Uncharacterized protein n=1 Tax=Coregonus suidteri TaxID=861788 RepID=A0AAN8LMG8_9TELE